MKHIAFIGIDGIGKSTLITSLQEHFQVISSPSYFEVCNHSFIHDSQILQKLSDYADEKKMIHLKTIAMFLQVSLFSEIERELLCKNEMVISFRHPLIDSLIYSQLYKKIINKTFPLLDLTEAFQHIKNIDVFEKTKSKIEKRVGRNIPWGNFNEFLFDLFEGNFLTQLEKIGQALELKLPSSLVWLDLPPEVAVERLLKSMKTLEPHETLDNLYNLQEIFRHTTNELEKNNLILDIKRLQLSADTSLEKLLKDIHCVIVNSR